MGVYDMNKNSIAGLVTSVLGEDFTFPNEIKGIPSKLTDFEGLEIDSFETSDGVELKYWAIGTGKPLIFLPGWSGNGTHFINVMYLLREKYRVYSLDFRNQGLSEKVYYGNRISRYATDVKEFTEHLGIKSADFAGHSMGAAVLWSYIDLYGTQGINKIAFVDQPPSILSRSGMTEEERLNAGVMYDHAEQLISAFTSENGPPIMDSSVNAPNTPYSENSRSLSSQFIKKDMKYMILIMFDHCSNDWRDVITKKINVPTAIFTGKYSQHLPSQRWMHSVMPNSTLYVYSKEEHGDHFLIAKNPVKFAKDLQNFLEGE
ncbi:alpha/beta fold hydrolase [Bacillus coreaensis]